MTYEEMCEVAGKLVLALREAGFSEVEFGKDDAKPGEPLPIYFADGAEMFALSLDVA